MFSAKAFSMSSKQNNFNPKMVKKNQSLSTHRRKYNGYFRRRDCLLRYGLGLLMSVHQTKWNFMFIFNPYSAVLIRIFPSSASKSVYSQKRAHSKMFVNDVSENHFSHWIWMVVLDVSASVCLLVWNIFPTCNFCRAHMASHLNSLWSR